MKTLLIDNYDSFTYNLYQLIAEISGCDPVVIKHDEMTYEALLRIDCDNVVISPGPGHPSNRRDFGLCGDVILHCPKPVLGVCLGHQGIAHVFSGRIISAPKSMHGRLSIIHHNGHPLFAGIPQSFRMVRYHSLMVDPQSLPDCLEVIAISDDGVIMAIAHREKPLYGVQFHPESIASDYGKVLMENFRQLTQRFYANMRIVGWAKRSVPTKITPFPDSRCSDKRPIQGDKLVRTKQTLRMHVKKVAEVVETSSLFQTFFSEAPHAIWLDSSRLGEGLSRFSFMGSLGGPLSYRVTYNEALGITTIHTAQETKQVNLSIFDYLQHQLDQYTVASETMPFAFHGGFVGYLGYELKQQTLPVSSRHAPYHDAQFLFLDRFIVTDHQEQETYVVCLDKPTLSQANQAWMDDTLASIQAIKKYRTMTPTWSEATREAIDQLCRDPASYLLRKKTRYLEDIACCKRHIRRGDSYELCLTNQIKKTIPGLKLLDYYQQLRKQNPAPYSSFLRFEDLAIACSSMERFLWITESGDVETKPIKGTLPRTNDPHLDKLLSKQLQEDEKFFSENLMIVDLLRNDLGSVCAVSSVYVPHMMDVESYATVHQLVSTIRGKLKKNVSIMECIKKVFPGGSVTGAPKIRATTILDEVEEEPRGLYTGSIGYLSLNGAVDLNIVIRTVVQQQDEIRIGIGGAIIDLSDPESEFDEMMLKAKGLLQSFESLLTEQNF